MVTVSGVVCIYYNVIISYAIFYLIASFGKVRRFYTNFEGDINVKTTKLSYFKIE